MPAPGREGVPPSGKARRLPSSAPRKLDVNVMQELNQDYSQAGFGGSIQPGARPALLIIDFVRAYLDPECSLYAGVEEELAQAVNLLGECRNAAYPFFIPAWNMTPPAWRAACSTARCRRWPTW